MREMPLDDYTAAVARHLGREPDERLRAACAIAQEKAQTLEEVWPLIGFLFEEPVDDEKAWRKVMKDGAAAAAQRGARGAARRRSPSSPSRARGARWRRSSPSIDVKPGKLYQPIRVAITGTSVSPGIFESLAVLGKDRSLERIERALERLSAESAQRMG